MPGPHQSALAQTGRNLFEVETVCVLLPQVARNEQPGAGCRNPFGIGACSSRKELANAPGGALPGTRAAEHLDHFPKARPDGAAPGWVAQ